MYSYNCSLDTYNFDSICGGRDLGTCPEMKGKARVSISQPAIQSVWHGCQGYQRTGCSDPGGPFQSMFLCSCVPPASDYVHTPTAHLAYCGNLGECLLLIPAIRIGNDTQCTKLLVRGFEGVTMFTVHGDCSGNRRPSWRWFWPSLNSPFGSQFHGSLAWYPVPVPVCPFSWDILAWHHRKWQKIVCNAYFSLWHPVITECPA